MPEVHKIKSGSLGVWPRKRASRPYPTLKSWVETDECRPLAFAGYKAGMTQITMKDLRKTSPTKNQSISVPVTVLDTPPLYVFGARSYKETRDGPETLEEIGAEEEKIPKSIRERIHFANKNKFEEEGAEEVKLLACTQPKRSGLGKKKPEVFEIPLGGSVEEQEEYAEDKIGEELRAEDVFEEGEFLDAVGITKGKGYQGPVKRYGVKIKNRKDENPRRIGSMGARGVGRVLFSTPQPGQMGYHRRTDEVKHLLKFGDGEEVNPQDGFKKYGLVKERYLMLKGSVPGPKKRLIMLRKSLEKQEKVPVEVKEIKTSSQQGV